MARFPRLEDPAGSAVWSRRRLLLAGGGLTLAGAAGLSGCTLSNPAVDSPASPSGRTAGTVGPTPSPAPSPPQPGYPREAGQEQTLAALAAAVGRRKALSGDQRRVLALLVAAHTDHARVLASADPTSRPSTTTTVTASAPSLDEVSTKDALKRLGAAEAKLAGSHRRAAVAASGPAALLWGSLAVAAEGFSTVDDTDLPPVVALKAHRPVVLLSDVAAVQQMVAQLHAIIWGYQLATGKISVTSKARSRALDGLLQHRVLRDRLIVWLNRRKAEVPPSQAAYAPSETPTDAGSAGRLIRGMETALLPYCGLWLAAGASEADRELALTTLRSTARAARSWGAGLRAWPGWSD